MSNQVVSIESAIQMGLRHQKAGRFASAERIYRRILDAEPDHSEVLHLLGVLGLQSGKAQEAIDFVNRALAVDPDNPNYLNSLGMIWRAMGDNRQALEAFDAALLLDSELGQIHANRGTLLLAMGRPEEAVQALAKAITLEPSASAVAVHYGQALVALRRKRESERMTRLTQSDSQPRAGTYAAVPGVYRQFRAWPEASYFYCPRYRFLYVSIPKVACSSFKGLIYELYRKDFSDIPLFEARNYGGRNFHMFMDRAFTLLQYTEKEAEAILRSPEIFKFTFVRNPLHRAASAYLNKFVTEQLNSEQWEHTLPLLRSVIGPNADPACDGITFRQFVHYLCEMPDGDLDKHWRPMISFFDPTSMDFVGHLETLDEDFATICRRLSLHHELPGANRSPTQLLAHKNPGFADMLPEELRALPGLPEADQLLDESLRSKLRARYAEDCRTFGYR